MSSARSSTSPVVEEIEEPRKKGARGGKRSVTHLSKAQLARKRANDREAQRNIRQRTKEHIENLENKVKELESGGRSSSVERILKRNAELEEEVERLRLQIAQVRAGQPSSSAASPTQVPQDTILLPQSGSLEWLSDQDPAQWNGAIAPHNPSLSSNEGAVDAPYTLDDQIYPALETHAKYEEADDQQPFAPVATPIWNDPLGCVDTQKAAWAPFHPALSQPSRFADLQSSGFQDVINTPTFGNTTCWQSQPTIYAWQISTKLKAPVTLVDQLMIPIG